MKKNLFLTVAYILALNTLLFAQDTPGEYSLTTIFTRPLTADANGRIKINEVTKNNFNLFGQSGTDFSSNITFNASNKTLVIDMSKTPANDFPLALRTTKNGKPVNLKITGKKDSPAGKPEAADNIENADRYTGIAFWDADIIYKNLNILKETSCPSAENKELITAIIKQYTVNSAFHQFEDIAGVLHNPFFDKINAFKCNRTDETINGALKQITKYKADKAGKAQASENTLVNAVLGSVSGIDVTKYVQAFADFLRDRIKEELTVAYIDKLKKILNSQDEFKYLLPKTYKVFSNNDVFNIPTMGPTYKAAFAEDLEQLADNFEKMVFSLKKYEALRTNDGFIVFMFAYHFAELSAKGYHPSDIIHSINSKIGFTVNTTSVTSYAISTLSMFSENLRDTSSNGWTDKRHINFVNKGFLNLFFGLLYEKYQLLFKQSYGSVSLDTILLKADAMDKVFDLLAVANTIDQRIAEFKGLTAKEKKENALGLFFNNADAVADIFENVLGIAEIKIDPKWMRIIGNAVEIGKGIKDTTIAAVGKVSINSIAILKEFITTDSELLDNMIEFTKFITDMASAKTAKDVRAILDKNAAPLHSYKVNRYSKFTVSIGAYPGIYLGLERNKQVEKGKLKSNAFGITAPIGLTLNFRTSKKDSTSIGVFFSVVDIAAALSYRWNNDTTDIPHKITLGQIFAPGVHIVYGIKNSPLAIKLGYQYAPQLRKIKTDQNEIIDNADVWRLSAGLTVDIPVFFFSHKK